MNIKQKLIILLVSLVLFSATALATSAAHDSTSKVFLKAPVAAFSASPISGYSPLKVVFNDKSTGSPTSWKWNFGDGTSSTANNPTHVFNKTGKYTVTLTVKNAKGSNKLTKYNYITVLVPLKVPVAAFSAFPVSGYSPLTVVFTDKSTGPSDSWKWNFGDGTSSTAKNPTHIYSKAGKYTVTLTVKNAKGSNKQTKYNYISVLTSLNAPVANFSSNVTKGYAPLSVQFNDSSNNANEWIWEFGDGTKSTDKNPVHIYTKDGTYNITLTVKNANGNNKTIKYNYITVDSTKVVDVVCNMTIYKITAEYTSEYKGITYYFCWSGCKQEFDANPERYINPPVANFSSNVTKGYAPLSVQFNDSSENAIEWYWDFGDGANSTDENPLHIYSNDGTYNVTLTAKNTIDNNTTTKYSYITVDSTKVVDVVCKMKIYKITAKYTSEYKGKTYYFCGPGCKTKFDANPEKYVTFPVANFSTNVSEGYAPLSVQFTDFSENATEVRWDFDNNGVIDSTDKTPIHEYTDPGNYTVNLTAVNANGTDSKLATINVFEEHTTILPVVNFSSNVTKGHTPLSVNFTDLSENASEWNWDFGDGNSSNEQNPVHIYVKDGIYNVTLTAKNADGNNKTTKYNYITIDSTKVVDVVCKMKIYKITAKYTSEYKGKTYYFCGPGCKTKFDANPEKYVTFPVANFSTNVSEGYAPLSVQFADFSENATEIRWDFDNNGVIDSTDKTPIHEYTDPGNYTVNLTAVNANGTDSKLATINVSNTVDSSKVLDVVCNMIIDKNTAEFTSVYKGKTYYFCSAFCKEEFDADPEKYVSS